MKSRSGLSPARTQTSRVSSSEGEKAPRTVARSLGIAASFFWNKIGMLFVLMILVIALSLLNRNFLTSTNLSNIALQSSINCILAIGMTFVIIIVGIDLSVGSIVAASSTIAVGLFYGGLSEGLAMLIGLLVGTSLGFINGWLIGKIKLSFFVVTLGMMSVARGIAYVYTGGRPITILESRLFSVVGRGYLGPVPVPVLIALALLLLGWFFQKYTILGRNIFIVGGNREAASLSGVNVDRMYLMVYTISGFMAATGGIVLAGRLASAQPIAGQGFELDAIAAVVVGGTSFSGGKGSVLGAVVGALILGTITNGMNLLNIDYYFQLIVKGVILICAISIDRISQSR